MRDYDGYFSDWIYGRILPDTLQSFVDFVKLQVPSGSPIVEIGCGNGLVAAALAEDGYNVTAIDIRYPAITEPFAFMLASAYSEEFYSFLQKGTTLIGRRALCLFYSDDWIQEINKTQIAMIISEALDGERHTYRNANMEARFLSAHGWEVDVEGKLLVAKRTPPKKQRQPKSQETEELAPE